MAQAQTEAQQPGPVPGLAEPFEPTSATPRAAEAEEDESRDDAKKHKKRGLFHFGKKKAADERKGEEAKRDEKKDAKRDLKTEASHATDERQAAGREASQDGQGQKRDATSDRPPPRPEKSPSSEPTTSPSSTELPRPSARSESATTTTHTTANAANTTAAAIARSIASNPPPPPQQPPPARRAAASPIRSESSFAGPSSPNRNLSSSPRLSSPAGSQIFERDVQESVAAGPIPHSPAIPSHIQTENYIPPVLDASSEAITDDHLDPDSVEIITHASHLPAALAVAGPSPPPPPATTLSTPHDVGSWADELASFAAQREAADSASNYGSFDTTDVRRLSFISFADVVQAEQQGGGGAGGGGNGGGSGSQRDSVHLAGLTSLASVGLNRSPSPVRSPVSSTAGGGGGGGAQLGTSPPTSKSGSVKGLEMSPARKPLGSPVSAHHPVVGGGGGELNVETMSQALRRTGSRDLSGLRSVPTSPV